MYNLLQQSVTRHHVFMGFVWYCTEEMFSQTALYSWTVVSTEWVLIYCIIRPAETYRLHVYGWSCKTSQDLKKWRQLRPTLKYRPNKKKCPSWGSEGKPKHFRLGRIWDKVHKPKIQNTSRSCWLVRFQVLTAASMMFRVVFWDILPCKIIVDRRFRGAYCLHRHGWSLIMEAVCTSETSVDNHFTRQYIPEDNSEHYLLTCLRQATSTQNTHMAELTECLTRRNVLLHVC
jgi:hypothetical protein